MTRRRTCHRCHKPIETCECGDDLAAAERTYGLLPMSLSVNCAETPIGIGGYDRPREIVENSDEVIARYREQRDPHMECAYCESRFRSKRVDEALRWFRTHPCEGEGETWHFQQGATA